MTATREEHAAVLDVAHETSAWGSGISLEDALARVRYVEVRPELDVEVFVDLLQERPVLVEQWLAFSESKRTSQGWYVTREGRLGRVDQPESDRTIESQPVAVAEYVLAELDFWAGHTEPEPEPAFLDHIGARTRLRVAGGIMGVAGVVYFFDWIVWGIVAPGMSEMDRSLATHAVLFGGLFLGAFVGIGLIRCPRCNMRPIWRAVSKQPHNQWFTWLDDLRKCPDCNFPESDTGTSTGTTG